MKVKIYSLTISIYLTALYSCQIYNADVDEVILTKDTAIIQLSDSSFFADVRSLYFDKFLYLTDYNRDQIIILDYNGTFVKSIGRKGKGPGEFLGASHIYVHDDTIYVANDSKRCFELYDFNKYLKTVQLPPEIILYADFRFFLKEGNLYLTSPSEQNGFVSVKINSNLIDHFGKISEIELKQQNYHKKKRHVFSYKNYIISVSDNIPIIEKYDLSGKLIEQFDYSKVPLVKSRIDFIQTNIENENSYYLLLNDAYLESDKLYVLLCTNEHNNINSNKVMAIHLSSDSMAIKKIYNLGVGWYSTICIVDDCLWAFSLTENSLTKFSLKD